MMPPTDRWKPKLPFDAAANPSHVTFDDGEKLRQNVPWLHYVKARWDCDKSAAIKMEVREWIKLDLSR
jgi:hypothetical protein